MLRGAEASHSVTGEGIKSMNDPSAPPATGETTTAPSSSEALGALPTEARNPRTLNFDTLSPLAMVQAMHAADAEALAAVQQQLPAIAAAIDAAAARMRLGGRLLYLGAGTSGRLGVLDASECPPTFHTPPSLVEGIIAGGDHALRWAVEGAEDDPALGASAIHERNVGPHDVVVGIAASGRTPYVLGAIHAALAAGALTIGLSCVPGSPVAQAAEHAISPDTGAEVLTGSTRLKAGTATKLVLNMLSTATLASLGYVHGNLMVNVQPTNGKLRDRAVRIVAELTGLEISHAAELFDAADGEVKTAVVMQKLAVSPQQARTLLFQAGGILRKALKSA
jgi:N-acetylmuramic acid 6-phosphate etherase